MTIVVACLKLLPERGDVRASLRAGLGMQRLCSMHVAAQAARACAVAVVCMLEALLGRCEESEQQEVLLNGRYSLSALSCSLDAVRVSLCVSACWEGCSCLAAPVFGSARNWQCGPKVFFSGSWEEPWSEGDCHERALGSYSHSYSISSYSRSKASCYMQK